MNLTVVLWHLVTSQWNSLVGSLGGQVEDGELEVLPFQHSTVPRGWLEGPELTQIPSKHSQLTTAATQSHVRSEAWLKVWLGNPWAKLQLKHPKVFFLHSKYSPQGENLQLCSSEPHVVKGLVNGRRNSMLENSSSVLFQFQCFFCDHNPALILFLGIVIIWWKLLELPNLKLKEKYCLQNTPKINKAGSLQTVRQPLTALVLSLSRASLPKSHQKVELRAHPLSPH